MTDRPLIHLTPLIGAESGGIGESVIQMCSSMAVSNTLRPHLIAYDEPAFYDQRLVDAHVEVQILKRLGPSVLQYAPSMPRVIEESRPRVVHQHGLWQYTSMAIGALRRRSGFEHVISPHGMLDPWALRHRGWKKRIAAWLYERRNLQSASCVHALCDAERLAIRDFGIDSPIAKIPNGVNLPSLMTCDRTDCVGQKQIEGKVLLFLGRMHQKKGLDLLLKAFGAVNNADWSLVIAGWGASEYETRLRGLARQMPCASRIIFWGSAFGSEKEALFRRATAFILPSFSEGMPMTVLEAWSYAKPAVITEHCNLPEGDEARACMTIEPTVESMIHGLNALYAMSDQELADVGSRGRQLVEQKFTWKVIARQYAELYSWIQGEGDKPSFVSS